MVASGSAFDRLRHADGLTRGRITAWALVLFLVQVLVLAFLALWQHGVFGPVANTPASDFASFYAAGKLALAGTPQLAYDQTAHYLAQQQSTGTSAPHQFFFYPPVYLLLCAGLATMPYLVAMALFEIATLAVFLLMMRALLREVGVAWLAPLLACPAVFWNVGLGQNAFLTATLFGGFTLLLDRRPLTAGMLLGGLCYKPHFGLLAPIALLAARRWAAFAAAAGTVFALIAASVALFGWQTWSAYMAAFRLSDTVYSSGSIDFAGIVTPFGAMRLMGLGANAAYAVQGIVAAAMALLVALLWHRTGNRHLRHAVLLLATLLAVPIALLYDKLLMVVALCWLLREARRFGFLSWERLTILALFPLELLSWPVGTAYHVPLGLLTTCVALALCLRRVWRARPAAVGYPAPLGATP